MKLYYANEAGRGMSAIIGTAGKTAHTTEANAYRATEAELQVLVGEIEAEFKPTETIRFDTIAEMVAAYKMKAAA